MLAGIAAADAICCVRLARRSAGENHAEAADLLAGVDRQASTTLRRLLDAKYRAQYDDRPVTAAEASSALRRAIRLVELAELTLAG